MVPKVPQLFVTFTIRGTFVICWCRLLANWLQLYLPAKESVWFVGFMISLSIQKTPHIIIQMESHDSNDLNTLGVKKNARSWGQPIFPSTIIDHWMTGPAPGAFNVFWGCSKLVGGMFLLKGKHRKRPPMQEFWPDIGKRQKKGPKIFGGQNHQAQSGSFGFLTDTQTWQEITRTSSPKSKRKFKQWHTMNGHWNQRYTNRFLNPWAWAFVLTCRMSCPQICHRMTPFW